MRHMHYTDSRSVRNREVWYHEHPASFLLDEEGKIIHDHKEEPPTYEVSTRFLLPADDGGAD